MLAEEIDELVNELLQEQSSTEPKTTSNVSEYSFHTFFMPLLQCCPS